MPAWPNLRFVAWGFHECVPSSRKLVRDIYGVAHTSPSNLRRRRSLAQDVAIPPCRAGLGMLHAESCSEDRDCLGVAAVGLVEAPPAFIEHGHVVQCHGNVWVRSSKQSLFHRECCPVLRLGFSGLSLVEQACGQIIQIDRDLIMIGTIESFENPQHAKIDQFGFGMLLLTRPGWRSSAARSAASWG